MTTKRLLKSIIAAAGTVLICSSAMADHQWGSYKWDRAPLAIEIIDNTTAHWPNHLGAAIYDWDFGTVSGAGWTDGNSDAVNISSSNGSNTACSPVSGNVQVCNDAYGDNGWLGIAQIWLSRGKNKYIIAGVAKMNDTYHNSQSYSSNPWRQLVMCQEIAHTFGLGHQDESFGNTNLGTCMDYTDDPDGTFEGQLNNEHPNQHDYDLLEQMYVSGGTDEGGEPKACNPKSPKCTQGIALENPADWGRLVSGHGAKEVYEKDLANGFKVVTHVTWTMEYAEEHDHDRRGH